MSAETRRLLLEAVAAHSLDEWGGALVVDFAIVAGLVDNYGDHSCGIEFSRETMPRYVARGLLGEGLRRLDDD